MSKLQTIPKKRLTIMVEVPFLKRLLRKLDEMSVPGYTVVNAIAGSGRSTNWRADALSSDTGQMAQVIMLVDEAQVEPILQELYKHHKKQMGIVSLSDEFVLMDEDFQA